LSQPSDRVCHCCAFDTLSDFCSRLAARRIHIAVLFGTLSDFCSKPAARALLACAWMQHVVWRMPAFHRPCCFLLRFSVLVGSPEYSFHAMVIRISDILVPTPCLMEGLQGWRASCVSKILVSSCSHAILTFVWQLSVRLPSLQCLAEPIEVVAGHTKT